MKSESTQDQLSKLLLEAKEYFGLQKEYLRLTMAEELTHILSAIAIAIVVAILSLVILVFLGIAMAHWIGEAIHNMGLCYAIFAGIMTLLLVVFYCKRRTWVILPLARMMTKAFLEQATDDSLEEENENAV